MTALAPVSISRDKLKKPTTKLETGKYGKVFVVKVKTANDRPKGVKVEAALKTLNGKYRPIFKKQTNHKNKKNTCL